MDGGSASLFRNTINRCALLNTHTQHTMITCTDHETIAAALDDAIPAIRFSMALNNLPYADLIPSLKAYALLQYDWGEFIQAYKRAAIIAARSGQGYAYID